MNDSSLTLKRLIYQSLHRGCKETDFVLGQFATHYLHTLTEQELQTYDELLSEEDWNIFSWVTENIACPEKYLALMEKVRHSVVGVDIPRDSAHS